MVAISQMASMLPEGLPVAMTIVERQIIHVPRSGAEGSLQELFSARAADKRLSASWLRF
ncbi:MAG: hypothetical protein M3463_06305 [Verrucomicrobiota bacterium]|nr:hypothetical protein [Verrucomicrobiota bacterium]